MKRNTLKVLFFLAAVPCFANAQSHLRIRAWQFHYYDIPYLMKAIDIAPKYDINTVIFSHNIVWYADEMLIDKRRGEQIDELAARAHRDGMKAWVWTHEIYNVPTRFLKNGKAQIDKPGFWRWEADKYTRLFERFRNVDGLVLTFHETQYEVYNDNEVVSRLSKSARVAKLINTIWAVCKKFGKSLVVRTFAYEPEQLQWIKEGILHANRKVIVETKIIPHDWDPYYPNNPLIGAFPGRKQIIEFHAAAEIGGVNNTPYACVAYFKRRLKYDLTKNISGYIARVDVGTYYHALGTPNELNMYTLFRLAQNPDVPVDSIYQDWAVSRYGFRAAPYVISALKRSFGISNETYYTLGFWITNHTALPTYYYASGHISLRSIAKWDPKPYYKMMEDELNNPTPEVLERILAQKDTAIAMGQESIVDLMKGKKFFKRKSYNDLLWRFELDLNATQIWKYFNEAFFGYKVLCKYPSRALRERVKRALNALDYWADINEKEFGDDIMPGRPARIRLFVKELRAKLQAM